MMIDKIGGVNPLNNVQNSHRINEQGSPKVGSDSISVSDEAKRMAALYYANKVSAETPDVRSDRIAAVKEKIKDPSYLSNAVIDSAADRIMTSFGL
ncbi:MAG: flagellar biosynthesis anti-sigma factor FlgM [Treponema socranskii subsp. buccale]